MTNFINVYIDHALFSGTLDASVLEASDRIVFEFVREEEAEEFAALFPKMCKAQCSTLSHYGHVNPVVCLRYDVTTDKRTGHANETAMKRRARTLSMLKEIIAK